MRARVGTGEHEARQAMELQQDKQQRAAVVPSHGRPQALGGLVDHPSVFPRGRGAVRDGLQPLFSHREWGLASGGPTPRTKGKTERGDGFRFQQFACSPCVCVCVCTAVHPRFPMNGTLRVHDSTQFPRSPRRGCRTVRSRGPLGQHTTAGPGRLARERGGHFTLHREASLPTVAQ